VRALERDGWQVATTGWELEVGVEVAVRADLEDAA
jgi:hypothetical protein